MSEVGVKAKLAQKAAIELNQIDSKKKNLIISEMAKALEANSTKIIKANALDLKKGQAAGISKTLQDRLRLDKNRIKDMANSLRTVEKIADPIGKILREITRSNGLKIRKISVPMGVIGIIYESRPNVTADAAGLCIKAGSAVVLRGGSAAANSNKAIVAVLRTAIKKAGVTPEILQLIESTDRKLVSEMLTLNQYLDLLIPRGGADLIQKVVKEATVPVIETGVGNCHVYIDKAADLGQAQKIVLNSKIQRPSVCNAAETLLVHKAIASKFLPKMIKALQTASVVIHGCPSTKKHGKNILTATKKDWATEYLALEMAVKVVANIDEAIEHIRSYGSKHTEAIVSKDQKALEKFSREIDASAITQNASTRFTDGGEFGFGCEIGISTQKLHARGPMGLPEITTYKYIVMGKGQIRT